MSAIIKHAKTFLIAGISMLVLGLFILPLSFAHSAADQAQTKPQADINIGDTVENDPTLSELINSYQENSPVQLKGKLVKRISDGAYWFSDGTAMVKVDIANYILPAYKINRQTIVEISGTINKGPLLKPEIDVDQIKLVAQEMEPKSHDKQLEGIADMPAKDAEAATKQDTNGSNQSNGDNDLTPAENNKQFMEENSQVPPDNKQDPNNDYQ